MYKLYKHTTPNGKVYIGITQQNIKKRWQNGNGYISNKYFYKAIQKYGWYNIIHEVIFDDLTKEQAEDLEKEYIKRYKSNIACYGYNIDSGGLCRQLSKQEKEIISKRNRNRILSKESKKKISNSLKEYYKNNVVSKETREKISNANKSRNNNYWKNKKFTDKHKNNISEGLKKSKKYKEAKCKKVMCIELQKIFNSIAEAEEYFGFEKYKSSISRSCKNNGTTKGYHWKYIVSE